MSRIELRRATDADADAVGTIFLESFRATYATFTRAHPDDEVREYVRDILIAQHETWVATDDGTVIGMMALAPGWVDAALHRTRSPGRGHGRKLLDLAKERSDGDLQLWTFQVNERARRFYERNGFAIAEMTDGANNQEREPDIRYAWRRVAD